MNQLYMDLSKQGVTLGGDFVSPFGGTEKDGVGKLRMRQDTFNGSNNQLMFGRVHPNLKIG